MKKTIINKAFLKKYESVKICFSSGDTCEIPITDVLELYCEALPIDGTENEYKTEDGFVRMSHRAMKLSENWILRNAQVREGLDITSFSLKSKRRQKLTVWVLYDPLKTLSYSDVSDSPAVEVDEVGDMLMAFGERTKQFKRQDNQYHTLVDGWTGLFGEYKTKLLRIKTKKLSIVSGEQVILTVQFDIRNADCKIKSAEFAFTDCKYLAMDLSFPERGKGEIVMSKMPDERILVGFDGLGIEFTCAAVLEHSYYCNQYPSDES